MKSFIKYPGGKTKELKTIRKNIPEKIDRYFEPFVGGGAVYFDLEIKKSFINDKSEDLVEFYRYIKNQDAEFFGLLETVNEKYKMLSPDIKLNDYFDFIKVDGLSELFIKFKNEDEKRKEKRLAKLLEEGKIDEEYDTKITSIKAAFYYTMRYVYNLRLGGAIHAVAYYFMREFCYSSMFRFSSRGDFNVPYGGKSYDKKELDMKIKAMKNCSLKKTRIYCEDFEKFLSRYSFKSDDFIFVDPPYDSEFSTYDDNEFGRREQTRLAEVLAKIPAKVMVVIKNTDFVNELYSNLGFNIDSFDKTYSVNFRNRNGRAAKHLMITNY